MKVQTRLLLYFATVTIVLLIPSLYAVSRLAQLRDLAIEGRSGQAAAVAGLGRLQTTMAELDRLERSYVATGFWLPEQGQMIAESYVNLIPTTQG